MNNNIIKLVFTFLILSTSISFAQDTDKEDQVLDTDQDKFITLSQVNSVTSKESRDLLSVSEGINSVFIQQIGVDNSVVTNIAANSSDIKIFQKGDENKIEIEESSNEITKMISQTGNNNTVIDFSFNPNMSTTLELIQEGDNLIFERFGTNELSKSLKFKMTGEARSIIVRSF